MENWIESQNRRGVMVRGDRISHGVAARDWYCSCGYKVVTKWYDEEPHWRSVCSGDETHTPDNFFHKGTIAYIERQRQAEVAQAREVFDHLPEGLREAIVSAPPTQEEIEDATDAAMPVEGTRGRSKLFKT